MPLTRKKCVLIILFALHAIAYEDSEIMAEYFDWKELVLSIMQKMHIRVVSVNFALTIQGNS